METTVLIITVIFLTAIICYMKKIIKNQELALKALKEFQKEQWRMRKMQACYMKIKTGEHQHRQIEHYENS